MTDPLARLERRIVRRLDVRARLRRVGASLPTILQLAVAVAAAYALAHWGIGHAAPVLAVTVTLNSLGFSRDARPRQVAERVLGIVIGVALSDAFVLLAGKGPWQTIVVLVIVLVVARFVSPSPGFALGAALPAALVALLPDPAGGPFARTIDGVIGGAMALLATALIPRDPRGAARRDARTLFGALDEGGASIIDALAEGEPAAGELALGRLRRTQGMVDDWTASLDTALAVSRLSPFLRRHLPELHRQERALRAGDLAARHLRVIARRSEFLVADRRPRPELAAVAAELRTAIRLLGASLEDPELVGAAGSLLRDLAPRLDPAAVVPGAPVPDAAIVLLVRPLVVDLLVGTGMEADAARALLPPL